MIKFQNKLTGHILILGWSKTTPIMFKEFSISSMHPEQKILLVAEKEPETELTSPFQNRFTFYTGNPSSREVLIQAEAGKADTICINLLGQPDGDAETASILSVLLPLLEDNNNTPHLIAIIDTEHWYKKIIESGCDPNALMCVENIFPSIAAQVCRQKNLKSVFNEILAVQGNDIYQYSGKGFIGYTWSKVLRAFENACPIGISQNETFLFNPDQGAIIAKDTELLILASDLKTIIKAPPLLPIPDYKEITNNSIKTDREESFLFLGWGPQERAVVSKLLTWSTSAITILIISENDPLLSDFTHTNLTISWQNANPHKDETLESIQFEYMENIILCGCSSSDSNTEIELLGRVKNILARTGLTNNITILLGSLTEESKNIKEALSTDILVTLTIQILLHQPLLYLSRELIHPKRAMIQLYPIENYVEIDTDVNFYTIIEAARKKNETAIGYISANEGLPAVCLNPLKTEKKRFFHFDKIIVFSNKNILETEGN